jgi:hypothetical protein
MSFDFLLLVIDLIRSPCRYDRSTAKDSGSVLGPSNTHRDTPDPIDMSFVQPKIGSLSE